MNSDNKTITFTLPAAIAARVDAASKEQGRSRSELIREAVARYIEDYEWRLLLNYGERRVSEIGIGPRDVSSLVEEYRAETSSHGA